MKKKSNLLNSITQYCEDKMLTIWSESKSGYYNLLDLRFYIGTNDNFLEYKKYAQYSYTKIKKNDNLLCEKYTINFYHNWKNIKEKNDLAVDVFWNVSSEDAKKLFSMLFSGQQIDLSVCLSYKNKNNPLGFNSSMNYSTGKNWRNFLECFDQENLSLSFNDSHSINNFFKVIPSLDEYMWHACLNYLTSSVTLSEDSQINISYKLKELFKDNENLLACYAERFSLLKELIQEDLKNNLFLQKEIYHLEKIELKRNDIIVYFNQYKIPVEKLIDLTKNFFILLNSNIKIKELGLEKLDLIEQENIYDNVSCLLNFSNTRIIDKENIVFIYKRFMDILLKNNEVIINDKNNNEKIKEIMDIIILKEVLDLQLPSKQTTKSIKI